MSVELRGWAATGEARQTWASYLPTGPADPEPAYAVADAWTPPHPMALAPELCARLLATARAQARPFAFHNGTTYVPDFDPADNAAVVGRMAAANEAWWGLEVTEWYVSVKRYRPGEQHPEHQDLHPGGAARRKLAGSVQLSDPADYEGGALVVRFAHHRLEMPRERGSLVAFPGWTVHAVEPVTAGERWALIVNGFGPLLR